MTIIIKIEPYATTEQALPPSQSYLLERALDSLFSSMTLKV